MHPRGLSPWDAWQQTTPPFCQADQRPRAGQGVSAHWDRALSCAAPADRECNPLHKGLIRAPRGLRVINACAGVLGAEETAGEEDEEDDDVEEDRETLHRLCPPTRRRGPRCSISNGTHQVHMRRACQLQSCARMQGALSLVLHVDVTECKPL